jgi:hypothetical protein
LGITDFDRFSRALRLRWLWHHWDHIDRPWKNLLKVTGKVDMQLFFTSTLIHIGDDRNTPFWEAKWLHEEAPKDLAPNLYQLTRLKSRSVNTELSNLNWIRNLKEISTTIQLEEFILLFVALSSVHLSDQKSEIVWKWEPNGHFSVASAYRCQFLGAMSKIPASAIWKSSCEPRSKIFSWLVMNNKVLTADNMIKKKLAMQSFVCFVFLCA